MGPQSGERDTSICSVIFEGHWKLLSACLALQQVTFVHVCLLEYNHTHGDSMVYELDLGLGAKVSGCVHALQPLSVSVSVSLFPSLPCTLSPSFPPFLSPLSFSFLPSLTLS